MPEPLKMCARCKKLFEKLYSFYHGFGAVMVCSDCWDKMEEAEGDK